MKTASMKLTLSSALLLSALPYAAQSQDIPENLKGTGEVVITSGGGTWEAAQKEAFFDPFTRDTGIRVVLVPEDHAKLMASVKLGQPAADITNIAGGQLSSWMKNGAAATIDYSYFAEDTLAGMPERTRNMHGVGALISSIGVAYNTTKYSEEGKHPRNWVDFYNVDEFPGKRGLSKCEKMLDSGLLEGALMGDGVSPDNLYPIDMNRAFAKLEEFKPHVGRWWLAGADAPQALIDGEVDMSSAYNGRIFGAKAQGAPLAFSWDQSLIQLDYWVVLEGSPNKENAMKFLAYISRPEPQAAFSQAMRYGPVNNDAYESIPEDLAKTLPGAPSIVDKQVYQNNEWWGEAGADGRTNFEVALDRCVTLLSQ